MNRMIWWYDEGQIHSILIYYCTLNYVVLGSALLEHLKTLVFPRRSGARVVLASSQRGRDRGRHGGRESQDWFVSGRGIVQTVLTRVVLQQCRGTLWWTVCLIWWQYVLIHRRQRCHLQQEKGALKKIIRICCRRCSWSTGPSGCGFSGITQPLKPMQIFTDVVHSCRSIMHNSWKAGKDW